MKVKKANRLNTFLSTIIFISVVAMIILLVAVCVGIVLLAALA